MTYTGHVENGVVVFDGNQLPPDGAKVQVAVIAPKKDESLSEMLLRHAGAAKALPEDMAEQHDHYLHGTPKRL